MMSKYYINRKYSRITRSPLKHDGLPEQIVGKQDMKSWADDKYIEIDKKQYDFYKEHPNASFQEIMNAEMMTPEKEEKSALTIKEDLEIAEEESDREFFALLNEQIPAYKVMFALLGVYPELKCMEIITEAKNIISGAIVSKETKLTAKKAQIKNMERR